MFIFQKNNRTWICFSHRANSNNKLLKVYEWQRYSKFIRFSALLNIVNIIFGVTFVISLSVSEITYDMYAAMILIPTFMMVFRIFSGKRIFLDMHASIRKAPVIIGIDQVLTFLNIAFMNLIYGNLFNQDGPLSYSVSIGFFVLSAYAAFLFLKDHCSNN